MTLAKLIQDCQSNKRAAQRMLYDRYSDMLMGIAQRYARDDHESFDILQNSFMKIFTKINSFVIGEGSFEGWMNRIVVNEALQLYRKNKKIFYSDTEIMNNQPEVENSAIDLLEAEDILKLLEDLPDGYRIVFNLNVVEGYSHKEIGEILGIKESASRSQLSRAKKVLQKVIIQKKMIRHAG